MSRPLDAVLSIQSAVAYGHVGNSAAVLPLQRLGFDVFPVHTVLLAHHPGHGRGWRGHKVTPGQIDEISILDVNGATVIISAQYRPDTPEEFVEEMVAFGTGYSEIARNDHRLFVDAFRNGQIPGLSDR